MATYGHILKRSLVNELIELSRAMWDPWKGFLWEPVDPVLIHLRFLWDPWNGFLGICVTCGILGNRVIRSVVPKDSTHPADPKKPKSFGSITTRL